MVRSAPTALLTIPGRMCLGKSWTHSVFLPKISSLLIKGVFLACMVGLVHRGVINTVPVKPFETVMMIRGYINTI